MIIKGDINGDRKIDILDVVIAEGYIMGDTELNDRQIVAGDINNDGVLDSFDLLSIKQHIQMIRVINQTVEESGD